MNSFYWNFFETFSYCTFHLFWMKNGSLELQQSFSQFSWNSTSLLPLSVQSQNLEMCLKPCEYFQQFSPHYTDYATQINLSSTSILYSKILKPSKFNSRCIIQLPVLNAFIEGKLEMYFKFFRTYEVDIHPDMPKRMHLADFLV